MSTLSENLHPPYYAAVVAPLGTDDAPSARMAMDELITLAPRLSGFLGLETGRLDDGRSATICYWKTPSAIQSWKNQAMAQLINDLNVNSRRIEDACAIEVTRIVKRLFGGKTPLTVSIVSHLAEPLAAIGQQGRAA